MSKTFHLTNHVAESTPEGVEEIAVGFINNADEFEILNNVDVDYDDLTTEEKAVADAFIDMMRAKVLASGDSGGS